MKRIALVALAPLLLTGCGGDSTSSTDEKRIEAEFYPLQYVAQRVAGDEYTVNNLTKPGQEPHDTELSLQKTADLSDAVVFYEKGLAVQVDDAIETAEPEHVVDAAKAADLDGDDPHFWLDPTRLSKVAEAFEAELAEADPDNAERFAANLEALQTDLADLDTEFETGLETCAVKTVVVSHDAFGYLGKRYGLDIVGINGLTPETEPSPAHIAELHKLIGSDHITTVFNEELASAQMAETLADDLGLKTAVLDPIEGRSDDTEDEDYLSLMRKNLAALQEANQCTS